MKRKTITEENHAALREEVGAKSQLAQWPCQIKLVPSNAPYFHGADLLVAADCAAYAHAAFHSDFMKNRITLITCPRIDDGGFTEKLTEIIKNNEIESVTVVRMEVACCAELERAAKAAISASGKDIPRQIITISTNGAILDRTIF